MELLYDVNLLLLPAEYLHAAWRITPLRTGRLPVAPWSSATRVELQPRTLQLRGAEDAALAGTWSLERTHHLSQPYLAFKLPGGEVQALVTRLRRSPSGAQRHLLLYFESGLELELTHP